MFAQSEVAHQYATISKIILIDIKKKITIEGILYLTTLY